MITESKQQNREEKMKTVVERASGTVRKKQIKKATLEIISGEGFKNLSTKNLASHVHLSEGAIFRHFHSKNDIILSIFSDVKDDLLKSLQKIAEKQTPPQKRLEEFMRFHIKYLKLNNGVTILLFTEAAYQNNNLLKKQLNQFFWLIKQYFGKIIHDGIALGIWNSTLSVDTISSLYIGIPITMNIEMNLIPEIFSYDNFCSQMFLLISRLLVCAEQ